MKISYFKLITNTFIHLQINMEILLMPNLKFRLNNSIIHLYKELNKLY